MLLFSPDNVCFALHVHAVLCATLCLKCVLVIVRYSFALYLIGVHHYSLFDFFNIFLILLDVWYVQIPSLR